MQGEYEWWPVKRITLDPEGPYVQVIRNSYWIINERDEVAMWRRADGGIAPQCNAHVSIAARLMGRIPGAFELQFLRVALVPINLDDYR